MKNVFHHDAVVTQLKYYCKQRNNIDVLQKTHSCFLFQFISHSVTVTKCLVLGGALLRPKGPKFKTKGQEQGSSPQWSSGQSPDRKFIFGCIKSPKMRLVG